MRKLPAHEIAFRGVDVMNAGVRCAGRAAGRGRRIASAPWRRAGLLVAVGAGVLVAPAHATAPGTNGLIAFPDVSALTAA
jgi:hypothetical protein